MQESDLSTLVTIEQSITPFPWTLGNFADSLVAGHSAWVGYQYGEIVGYAVMSIVAEEAELLNIGIDPECQRCGRGIELMVHLLQIAKENGVGRMFLEVRRSNISARAFYDQFYFNEVGLRRDYYVTHKNCEDAIVMARNL
ncbi:MAG: ribosomal protein S18-alanine N-acetyltransferase [Rhodocyclaceae bacterium]|nr:ribosomal protein S18-alanine N-acetyltransferase [Rhodocyclaceae bacterium]